MAILVTCGCGNEFDVGDELAGKRVKCPRCRKGAPVLESAAIPEEYIDLDGPVFRIETDAEPTGGTPKHGVIGRAAARFGAGPKPLASLDDRRYEEVRGYLAAISYRLGVAVLLLLLLLMRSFGRF